MTTTTALRVPQSIADLNNKLGWPVSPILGTTQLQKIYEEAVLLEDGNIFENILKVMNVSWEVTSGVLSSIPREGPLVVVANHPFGGLDGVILGAALSKVRPDFKLLLNYLLNVFPALGKHSIPVDPFGNSPNAANLSSMRQSIHHLKQGGCLLVFPAGKVSHFHWEQREVIDDVWNTHAAALAQKTRAKIVPIHFSGRNSIPFQAAGMVHPRLRTALLPREMIIKTGSTLQFSIGRTIGPEITSRFETPDALSHYLRLSTYALKGCGKRQELKPSEVASPSPVIDSIPSIELSEAVEALPLETKLLSKGEFSVYCQTGEHLPDCILKEIGRLREITFREIGEGTGQALDLDQHDASYYQLFLWNEETSEIVGAYRLALLDQVVKQHGKDGLYSASLFNLKEGFLQKLGKTVELGRSFIRPEYQRKHSSLSLIWQGIGQFLSKHPEYQNLFGCVSLTSDYAPISRDLIVEFLKRNNWDQELSLLVDAKQSPEISSLAQSLLGHMEDSHCSIDAISAVVSSIEQDGKGIPVLLRHYLKLNGTLLNFNVDPAFNNTTVGLILVRIPDIEPGFRKKFLGN
jgi:putative hemolysin